MSEPNARAVSLSGAELHRLESLLVEFDKGWDENRLTAAARQLDPADPLRLPALRAMVKVDLERRWRAGKRAMVEGYLKAFPELGTPETVDAGLLVAEYQARHQFGDRPGPDEYARRFPQRGDELRRLLAGAGRSAAPGSSLAEANRQTVGTPEQTHRPGEGAGVPEQVGRYRIVKKLGQGGMASVYLAEDTQLDRPVALKVPLLRGDDQASTRQRFLREAQAAANLRHANICPVYDVGEADGVPYLTMAYVEGRPLSHFLRGRALPQRQAALMARKLALALQEAHAAGIVHRDLKPSNVMIDQNKEPVIMDFGLAQRVDTKGIRLTQEGAVLGTPAYMSPEQAGGEVAAMGPRCDVYGLGVMLYEMLTGRLPFEGPLAAVFAQVLTKEPEPPSSLRPGLDPRLEAACLQAMAKKPADRFASMKEFAAALAECLTAPSQTVRPAPPATQTVAAEDPFKDLGVGEEALVAVPARKGRAGKRSRDRRLLLIGASIAAAVLAVAVGVVILVKAGDYGTVKIELPGGTTGVTVEVNGAEIDLKGLDEPIRLKAGEHGLEVRGKNFKTYSKKFVLTRGEAKLLEVTLEPAAAALPAPDGKPITNSIGMKLALIPAGKFTMGSPKTPAGFWQGEDEHEVAITEPFYLGVYEVTQEEYQKVMGINPSYYSARGGGKDKVVGQDTTRFPVEAVTWLDARLFCRKLAERPEEKERGRQYRLPTEAEWEYSCRAGTTSTAATTFHFGDALVRTQANFGNHLGRTTKVGSYEPNHFGLHDMHGNVSEWCADWLAGDYYQNSPREDPLGPGAGVHRVVRGGSWSFSAEDCRATKRVGNMPVNRHDTLGFRVVCVPAPGVESKLQPPPVASPADALRAGRIKAPDLSKARVLHNDEFDNPKSGFPVSAAPDRTRAYQAGKYFIRRTGSGWTPGPWKNVGDCACLCVGRARGGTDNIWGIEFNNPLRKLGVGVYLTGRGELRLHPTYTQGLGTFPPPYRDDLPHPAIKPGEQWNTLLAVVRGRTVEVYVNGVAVCEPMTVDFDFLPCQPDLLGGIHDTGAAEFERVTVYSADGLPALADRLAKPAGAPPAPGKRTVNLLPLLDPARDAVHGAWKREGGDLVSDGSVAYARLRLPYQPPEEYDFRIEFTQRGGSDLLQLLTGRGRSFTWLMGAWGGRWDCFDTVKGHPCTREGGNILGAASGVRRGGRHVSVVQVRKDSIAAFLDGKLVVRHPTDFSDLGIPREWSVGEGALGLGTTFCTTVFHAVEVVEVSGTGKPLRGDR